MEKSRKSVDRHLADLPEAVRPDLIELDRLISESMPGASRTLWEGRFWGGTDQQIIGYGDFTYTGSNKKPVAWFVVGLAAQKNHISLYVSAADDGGYLVGRHADRLGKVKTGSAVVNFKSVSDLDLEAVRDLVAEAHEWSKSAGLQS